MTLPADDRIRCLRCGLEMDPRLWRSCTKGGSCYWRVPVASPLYNSLDALIDLIDEGVLIHNPETDNGRLLMELAAARWALARAHENRH